MLLAHWLNASESLRQLLKVQVNISFSRSGKVVLKLWELCCLYHAKPNKLTNKKERIKKEKQRICAQSVL